MKFKIPFTASSLEKLAKKSRRFSRHIRYKKNSPLQRYLENSNINLSREAYLGICIRSFLINIILLTLFFTTALFFLKIKMFYAYGPFLAMFFSGFIFFIQMLYPRMYSKKREKDIEKNIIPALQDMLVQLNSGIPLFSIMMNISIADYGELSTEFKKVVKKINVGMSEIDVIDNLGETSSSVFFKRILWQISNGLRAGSDMAVIIENSINTLNEEQVIQMQKYGNKLNPIIMFYMLSSVIVPALSVTFLVIISSIVHIEKKALIMIFIVLFVVVALIQISFLGVIKSSRPNLLE